MTWEAESALTYINKMGEKAGKDLLKTGDETIVKELATLHTVSA